MDSTDDSFTYRRSCAVWAGSLERADFVSVTWWFLVIVSLLSLLLLVLFNNGSQYNKCWSGILSPGRRSHALRLLSLDTLWHLDPNHLWTLFVMMGHKQSYQNCNYHFTSTHFMTQRLHLKLLWRRSSVEDEKSVRPHSIAQKVTR